MARYLPDFDPERAIRLAFLYNRAAAAAEKSAWKTFRSSTGSEQFNIDIFAPGNLLVAMAAELLLKAILKLRGQKVPTDHRLDKLFASLPKADQEEIERLHSRIHDDKPILKELRDWASKENRTIETHVGAILSTESDSAMFWRYLHEERYEQKQGRTFLLPLAAETLYTFAKTL